LEEENSNTASDAVLNWCGVYRKYIPSGSSKNMANIRCCEDQRSRSLSGCEGDYVLTGTFIGCGQSKEQGVHKGDNDRRICGHQIASELGAITALDSFFRLVRHCQQ